MSRLVRNVSNGIAYRQELNSERADSSDADDTDDTDGFSFAAEPDSQSDTDTLDLYNSDDQSSVASSMSSASTASTASMASSRRPSRPPRFRKPSTKAPTIVSQNQQMSLPYFADWKSYNDYVWDPRNNKLYSMDHFALKARRVYKLQRMSKQQLAKYPRFQAALEQASNQHWSTLKPKKGKISKMVNEVSGTIENLLDADDPIEALARLQRAAVTYRILNKEIGKNMDVYI
jgi:hypothetical protein